MKTRLIAWITFANYIVSLLSLFRNYDPKQVHACLLIVLVLVLLRYIELVEKTLSEYRRMYRYELTGRIKRNG